MKYAFMSFSCPELNLEEIFRVAGQYGYDGFEPRAGSGHRHGIEADAGAVALTRAKKMAEDFGVAICCVATSCAFADPDKAEAAIDVARRYIDTAARVGAPVIRVFGGVIPQGVSRERSAASMTESLIRLAEEARQADVRICVETHDNWCDPMNLVDVVAGVNHSSVAINWDIMHPALTASYTMERAFETVKPWIGHVHVHDGIRSEKGLEFRSIGEGGVDHGTAIRLLGGMDYDGFISGEWIEWEPYEVHLPRELKKIKAFEL